MFEYIRVKGKTHRLIPSRYPPVSLFDWVESKEELEQVALLEGLTNDRLTADYGTVSLINEQDWVGGPGSTPLMAAFTHFGYSRFSDGQNYGVYYAGESVATAIAETKYHREIFLAASNEAPCIIQMRQYTTLVKKDLLNLCSQDYPELLHPGNYQKSQEFGRQMKIAGEWGLYYPSVRCIDGSCIAIFRPPALSIPVQAGHYDYIWDGCCINEVRKSILMS